MIGADGKGIICARFILANPVTAYQIAHTGDYQGNQ
jgi:hypothetical protein